MKYQIRKGENCFDRSPVFRIYKGDTDNFNLVTSCPTEMEARMLIASEMAQKPETIVAEFGAVDNLAARLFAAAPDFAEALREIANQSARDHEDPEQEAYASRAIAANALAKAGL